MLLTGKEALTHFPSLGTSTNPAQGKAHMKQCDLLKLSRKQKRLCRREPGLAETLRDAIRLGIMECQFQFRSERWNCSLEGRTISISLGAGSPGICISFPAVHLPPILPTKIICFAWEWELGIRVPFGLLPSSVLSSFFLCGLSWFEK
uniref:Protein Wnt n=1 Tax=Pavo cristatus TaxID=9049 RepID=A0A8C9EL67_PAVCR